MISRKLLVIGIMVGLLFTGVAVGATNVSLERIQPMEVSQTTSANNPLVEMTFQQEIPSGTENVELVTIYNNYDETQDVTFDISNTDLSFSSGGTTQTFSVAPNSSTTVYVDTPDPQKTCAETQQRQPQTFTYDSTSPTYTVNTTTQTVDLCQPGGGGGPGNGGGNGGGNGPGGGGPPGQN